MATKGDKLTNFITAQWYNEVTEKLRSKKNSGNLPYPIQNQYITLKNNTGTAFEKWSAVRIGDSVLDYTTDFPTAHQDFIYEAEHPDDSDPFNLCILQEPLPNLGTALALVSGCSWLFLEEIPDEDYIWCGSGSSIECHREGRIEVLKSYTVDLPTQAQSNAIGLGPNGGFNGLNFGPASTSQRVIAFCLVGLLVQRTINYVFVLKSAFVNKIATADIYTIDGVSITLYETDQVLYDNRSIFTPLDTGDDGYCFWQEDKYYVFQAPCPN